ncbi:MAG: DNA-directed RNA polymerase subunit alpha [Candidatus Latescibacterota bacterium]|nr:MAG: DNA-directed RNA polymerase subunit alpha [Candidatus Latescibacterota bacterium]
MELKDFCMPDAVEVESSTRSPTYGKFIVQPLERGFGTTLGNALRRVLLSSIEGSAIKAIRIDGVQHEFSTIPGVLEDVQEIILNLKEVRLKLYGDGERTLVVEKEGAGELKAGDLEVDPTVRVLNPEHHIATLSEDARFRAEISVGKGRGYVPAEENKKPDQPIGTIAIDAIYSPVRRVNYYTENTRVGRRTDYDRLILEVWTDGTVTPEEAVSSAAEILMEHLKFFSSFKLVEREGEEIPGEEVERMRRILDMSVDDLELSARAANCLRTAGIHKLKDLVQKTEQEMLKYRNFGKKSLQELSESLRRYGLRFGMDLTPYLTPEEREQARRSDEAQEEGEEAEQDGLTS